MKLNNLDYNKTIKDLKKDSLLKEVYYYLINNNKASNLPYHNNIHSITLGLLMFEIFREDKTKQKVATISGFLHDFNHTGNPDSKSDNIERAKNGVFDIIKNNKMCEDVLFVISKTEYPYKESTKNFIDLKHLGDVVIAMRLADHAWQNIFPFDIGSIGIHKEQYSNLHFKDVEIGSVKFRNNSKKEFLFLKKKCPKILKPIFDLYLNL